MVYEKYTADHSRSGAHAFSATGTREWRVTPNASWVPTTTELDGRPVQLTKRERYQITLDTAGHPSLLFNGGGASERSACFNMVEPFN